MEMKKPIKVNTLIKRHCWVGECGQVGSGKRE